MGLVVIGISHKTAPVDIRERFSFTTSGLKDSLAILKDSELISGAVILSTCNRMEIYVDTLDNKLCVEFLKKFVVTHFGNFQGQSPKMSRTESGDSPKNITTPNLGGFRNRQHPTSEVSDDNQGQSL